MKNPSPSLNHIKYLEAYKRRRHFITFFRILIFLVLIALWEAGARFGFINSFVFCSPSEICLTIWQLASDGSLFFHLGITLFETFVSFAIIIVVGILTAILLWWNETVAKIADPYLVVLNSLPKSALAPVFIVWLGSNMTTIITAAVSVAVFGTIITLYDNFRSVDPEKIKLIYTLRGNKRDVLFRVILPSNLGAIISLMKVNIGLSLVGVIIAEFIAAKAGLGYLIIYGTQVFKLSWVISSIALLCVIATALYKLLSWVEKKYGGSHTK